MCMFGSLELRAHFEYSDMDILCVGPRHVTLDMLFTDFAEIIKKDARIVNVMVCYLFFVICLSIVCFFILFLFFCIFCFCKGAKINCKHNSNMYVMYVMYACVYVCVCV